MCGWAEDEGKGVWAEAEAKESLRVGLRVDGTLSISVNDGEGCEGNGFVNAGGESESGGGRALEDEDAMALLRMAARGEVRVRDEAREKDYRS